MSHIHTFVLYYAANYRLQRNKSITQINPYIKRARENPDTHVEATDEMQWYKNYQNCLE